MINIFGWLNSISIQIKLNSNGPFINPLREVLFLGCSEVTIKSKFSQKFLGFKFQTQALTASFPPPCVNNNNKSTEIVDMALKFRIVPRDGEKNSLVVEGSRIYLIYNSSKGNN